MAKKRAVDARQADEFLAIEAAQALKGDASKRRIRELEEQLQTLSDALAKTRNANAKIPVQRKSRCNKKAFIRLFVPDSHGNAIDHAAASALLADLEYLYPREIFLMGDHLDCGGFLAQHHTLGFVAQTEATFENDVMAANLLLDAIQQRAPSATIKYLEGNHEERIEKWIVTAVLRNGKDAKFLRTLCGPEAVLHLDKRGIPYIKKSICYDGCRVQGTLKAGKCFVTHGTSHGKNAANVMLNRFNANVVFAHVHKLMAASDRNVKDGELGAWSVGHIGQQQPLWRHGHPTDWSQGYGFQIVQPNGDFLHINVPIVDGHSMLTTLGALLQ
jgi:hypothetical protein